MHGWLVITFLYLHKELHRTEFSKGGGNLSSVNQTVKYEFMGWHADHEYV